VWKFVPGLDYKFGLILGTGISEAAQPQRTATNGMASLGNCKYKNYWCFVTLCGL